MSDSLSTELEGSGSAASDEPSSPVEDRDAADWIEDGEVPSGMVKLRCGESAAGQRTMIQEVSDPVNNG